MNTMYIHLTRMYIHISEKIRIFAYRKNIKHKRYEISKTKKKPKRKRNVIL